jgi:hypothetical protein
VHPECVCTPRTAGGLGLPASPGPQEGCGGEAATFSLPRRSRKFHALLDTENKEESICTVAAWSDWFSDGAQIGQIGAAVRSVKEPGLPLLPKSGRCRAVTDDAVVVYRGWYG